MLSQLPQSIMTITIFLVLWGLMCCGDNSFYPLYKSKLSLEIVIGIILMSWLFKILNYLAFKSDIFGMTMSGNKSRFDLLVCTYLLPLLLFLNIHVHDDTHTHAHTDIHAYIHTYRHTYVYTIKCLWHLLDSGRKDVLK